MKNNKLFDEYITNGTPPAATPGTATPPVVSRLPTVRSSDGSRLAIIGDIPTWDDVRSGVPFSGGTGRWLSSIAAHAQLSMSPCLMGLAYSDRDMTQGPEALSKLLQEFQPNLCLLLGADAFHLAKTGSLESWRGSLFISDQAGPFLGRKCLASWHPRDCFMMYERTPLLLFDLIKAKRESLSPSLVLPQRELLIPESPDQTLEWLRDIRLRKPRIAIDIEGYVNAVTCISIADSPKRSFIVPLSTRDGDNFYSSVDVETAIWQELAAVLADSSIFKVLQNGAYDRFVLQYSYGLIVRGVVGDTMLKHWEKYCELDKNLGFLCSIYTEEPFYKMERKDPDRETYWKYCCRDSAVTHEIDAAITPRLGPASRSHYHFNMAMVNLILYMEMKGIRYDVPKARLRHQQLERYLYELQYDLDAACAKAIPFETSRGDILSAVQEAICYKRDPSRPKKGREEEYERIYNILTGEAPLEKWHLGYINKVTKAGMNLRSPGFKGHLYGVMHMPPQYNKDGALTTNYQALLKLSKTQNDTQVLGLAIEIGELRTRYQMLGIGVDPDGRVRCSYNPVGTETGRFTCSTSPTRSGYNLQTIPDADKRKPVGHPLRDGMRDIFLADEGYDMFQCDLSGADGWTVAAWLASLGDRTMLEDLLAGIKPAKVLCYMVRSGGAESIQGLSRKELKLVTNSVEKDSWDYFASKIGQHGTCYLMGPDLLADMIFVQSEGKMKVTSAYTAELQKLFKVRYRIDLWHQAIRRSLARKPELTAASGATRRFFGHRDKILGAALSHEPQANTTYITNLAAYRLWTDPENRTADGRGLIIQPLHQVHDAVVGQFPSDRAEWAKAKIREYFNNPITIAGIRLVVPFEGNYGESWGNLQKGTI